MASRLGIAAVAVALLAITACSSSKADHANSTSSAGTSSSESAPLTSTLPSSIRKSGVLNVAVTNASPPEASVCVR